VPDIYLFLYTVYSFTPPMVRPVTKYLCKNGYRQTIGSMVTTVAAARIDVGVIALPAVDMLLALPNCHKQCYGSIYRLTQQI